MQNAPRRQRNDISDRWRERERKYRNTARHVHLRKIGRGRRKSTSDTRDEVHAHAGSQYRNRGCSFPPRTLEERNRARPHLQEMPLARSSLKTKSVLAAVCRSNADVHRPGAATRAIRTKGRRCGRASTPDVSVIRHRPSKHSPHARSSTIERRRCG